MALKNLHFVDEALRLVGRAEERGIQLRILGSIAYRLHSPANIHLFSELERELTDVDLGAYRHQSHAIREFMKQEGYASNEGMFVGSEGARHVYRHPQWSLHVDVFTDELNYCHPIPFKGRLELDSPTLTTTDLLLEKMQIVEINLKDLKDTMVLLIEHPIADPSAPRESIDSRYIAQMMSQDWGFYHTFTSNLRKVAEFIPQFPVVGLDQAAIIRARIDQLLVAVEETPKSMKWKIRSKIGTRTRWYQEVSENGEIF
jgi:hypothetical protein